jgi:hypothetical protein
MGLFDSVGELSVSGDFAQVDAGMPSYNLSESFGSSFDPGELFRSASVEPDGIQLIDQRANSSWWDFDQSKITSSIQDVIGSVTQAAVKTAIQKSGDSINTQANMNNSSWLTGFAQNFRSTQTGAQINAASYATQIQNFFANPIIWFVGIALVGMMLFMRR